MTETILFGSLNFVYWNLFVIWCLEFGAYTQYVVHFEFYSSFSAFFFSSSRIFKASRGVS